MQIIAKRGRQGVRHPGSEGMTPGGGVSSAELDSPGAVHVHEAEVEGISRLREVVI